MGKTRFKDVRGYEGGKKKTKERRRGKGSHIRGTFRRKKKKAEGGEKNF